MSSDKIVSGVFAIHKPLSITSAQVIRDAQQHFRESRLFQPWLVREQARRDDESSREKSRRRKWHHRQPIQVKMGHGGTLDPEATGVLILGVGDGTKSLSDFLGCTKSYECVVLFGAATDTYDGAGRIVARKPYAHVTREMVEKALDGFRGDIMQRPPIYSALRVQGKRLYEYAREGKELPVEIQERPMRVDGMEMLEWFDGGTHSYNWPVAEAEQEEKEAIGKIAIPTAEKSAEARATVTPGGPEASADSSTGEKRKRDDVIDGTAEALDTASSPKRPRSSSEPAVSGALPELSNENLDGAGPAVAQSTDAPSPSKPVQCSAPACRIRMTVTSGFYVRSFCHDLGAAVGSLAIMAALVRTRQADFELGKNVLEYSDLGKGEEVWGPELEMMLDAWQREKKANIP